MEIFFLSLVLVFFRWRFLIVSKGYLCPNMPLCTSATGSICDVSAVSPDKAPTGLTQSSGFLWDLLNYTDTDKSPHKSAPQIPWPLIKVIRPWSAISNHRQLLAAVQMFPLVRGLVPYHLLTNVSTGSSVSQARNWRAVFKDDLCVIQAGFQTPTASAAARSHYVRSFFGSSLFQMWKTELYKNPYMLHVAREGKGNIHCTRCRSNLEHMVRVQVVLISI